MSDSGGSFSATARRLLRALPLGIFLALGASGPRAQDVAQAAAPIGGLATTPIATPIGGLTAAQSEAPIAAPIEGLAAAPIEAPIAESSSEPPALPSAPPEEGLEISPLPPPENAMGPEAWYYEAKKLEQSGDLDPLIARSIDMMYALAFHFGERTAAREAGKALLQRSIKAADAERAKAIALQWLDYFGSDWDVCKALITVYMGTGDYKNALGAIDAFRATSPSTAKTKANELAFYEYSSKAALEDFSWSGKALALLKTSSLDLWGSKILRLTAGLPTLDTETRELCLMRAAYQEKNFDEASLHARGASIALHAAGIGRFLISEAGKSFLNAGAREEGIAFFMDYFPEAKLPEATDLPEAVGAALVARNSEERLWVAAYYLARLWLSAERSREAAILFLALTDNAPSAADADGALWYWLDITMKRIAAEDIASFDTANLPSEGAMTSADPSIPDAPAPGARRSLEFGALVEASARWKNPAYFDDIVESYDRNLLKEKSWNDVLSLLVLIGERVSPGMKTRLLYQGGRLIEERLARQDSPQSPSGETAAEYFRTIVENPDSEEYYRTMSAWRLGIAPPFLDALPSLAGASTEHGAAGEGHASPSLEAAYSAYQTAMKVSGGTQAGSSGNGLQSAFTLIRNYLNYDLDEMASAIAMSYIGSLDKSLIAGLAFELSSEGQHYAALRLARDAVNRGAGRQYPELYSLVYPKAWNGIIAEGAAIPGIPEALAYGIIRSESVFDPKAVSYAGAVGLTQLMPSTAAETARGLKMGDYSLTDPADNVRIGLTYYSYMLARFGGKPMRAMFAYNAGPSRMMNWAKESGELPDDILLETLHLAQPRQYAKNIIQASLAYGKIQYGIDARAMLDYLVLGNPLPTAAKASTETKAPTPTENPAPATPASVTPAPPASAPSGAVPLTEAERQDLATPASDHGFSLE